MGELKESGQAVGATVLTGLSDFAPPTIMSQAARLQSRQRFINLVVTNVPGPQYPLYLLGRRMVATEPMVPVDVLPETVLQASGVRVARAEGSPLPADASLFEIVNDFERRTILERLERCTWSQTEAAESLHVPLSTLNQKIKRLDIKIKRKSEQ